MGDVELWLLCPSERMLIVFSILLQKLQSNSHTDNDELFLAVLLPCYAQLYSSWSPWRNFVTCVTVSAIAVHSCSQSIALSHPHCNQLHQHGDFHMCPTTIHHQFCNIHHPRCVTCFRGNVIQPRLDNIRMHTRVCVRVCAQIRLLSWVRDGFSHELENKIFPIDYVLSYIENVQHAWCVPNHSHNLETVAGHNTSKRYTRNN